MQPVQAIFFDFDNTLADDDACLTIALARVCQELRTSLPEGVHDLLGDTYRGISDAYWLTTPYADISEARLRLWRQALANHGCYDEALVVVARDAYELQRRQVCELYEDTREVIESLSRRYRLAIVTNGGSDQQTARLRYAAIDHHFELVVAADSGVGKPEAAIFQKALDQLNVDPAAVWHVGDRLDADVLGAHNAGLTSVWLNRTGALRGDADPVPHHEIASLADLPSLLALEA